MKFRIAYLSLLLISSLFILSCGGSTDRGYETEASTFDIPSIEYSDTSEIGRTTLAQSGVFVYLAGINDNFALPFEPTSPSADLLLKMDPYGGGNRVLFPHRQFDDKAVNRVFGHTFTYLPTDIQAATLEIHLFAGGSSLVSNDAIHLELTGINDNTTSWNMGLTALYGQSWSAGSDHTFILDLANLPPDAQGDTNIIPFMNADNALDVYVQDDTGVDYIKLTVTSTGQVVICHIPPGNPSGAHTITVNSSAANAHLKHGDTLGPCE